MMSLHKLSAGAGYRYLLQHTASGDVDRTASSDLTAYYAASGNPPGRWIGQGLAGLPGGAIASGMAVSETAMARVVGAGEDPTSGIALGTRYPVFASAPDRINAAIAALPDQMDDAARAAAIETLTRVELAKAPRTAVAGFDLTFTAPKSASVLWGLADPVTQSAVVAAHHAAVDQALAILDRSAIFTRVGARGCGQVPTRGMIAAAFDHPDTRTGDPNLHTHVVVANKVQGLDGKWRSLDSRALHHAIVSVSEVYDNLFADELTRRLPVTWQWRERGARRSPAYELTDIPDALLRTFSTRATAIDEAMAERIDDFTRAHGRGPHRLEVLRLRQVVTRATRPNKTVRALPELMAQWRDRASTATGQAAGDIVRGALGRNGATWSAEQIPDTAIDQWAGDVLAGVMERRSTWTASNLLAETARRTRDIRMATTEDRQTIHDRVVHAALGVLPR